MKGYKEPDVCQMLDWERLDSNLEEVDEDDLLAAAEAYRRGVRVGYAFAKDRAGRVYVTCVLVGAASALVFLGLIWILIKVL